MYNMRAIVTGAAGFTGSVLTEVLRKNDIEVYAIVREGSAHNSRLDPADDGLHIISTDMSIISDITGEIGDKCDFFFHIAWDGGSSVAEQQKNVEYSLESLKVAHKLGCHRFIATGSQAEYGIVSPDEEQAENREVAPFTAYGAAKVASCYLSRQLADELGIEWIWGRIFSLIGKYEPTTRMLPALYHAMKEDRVFRLSSCRQNWDYLDVYDAAEALLALAYKGRVGEIYNIANGDYRPLKECTEELRRLLNPDGKIIYGDDPDPFVSLQPSVEKIKADTGWKAKRSFAESLADYDMSRC